jgi:N-acetylmuramoyl-L-alanine amidase
MMARPAFLFLLFLPWIVACGPIDSTGPNFHGVHQRAGKAQQEKKRPSRSRVKKIVLDAGHGGDDYGTHSVEKPKYHEKFLTLATALMVRDQLKKMGYQVIMTRSDDRFITLDQRAKIANSRRADLFISLHYNSAPSRKAHGAEIFFYNSKKDKGRASQSKKLATKVLGHLTKGGKRVSRGVKAGNFSVIRNTNMPAILVEAGFLTNADEMRHLGDPKNLNKIAWGIAKGVDEFLR